MSLSDNALPILYSFRRCPYAMRARLALKMAGVSVQLREILLKQKPEQMLALSPKGTVPVLLLPAGQVLDESRDILLWASRQSVGQGLGIVSSEVNAWLDANDFEFKENLDRYKYADRYPEKSAEYYRAEGERFLAKLELQLERQHKLGITHYLLGSSVTLADIGIFPFVRQFSMVDQTWFETSEYIYVRQWLGYWLVSDIFQQVMIRYQPWQVSDDAIFL